MSGNRVEEPVSSARAGNFTAFRAAFAIENGSAVGTAVALLAAFAFAGKGLAGAAAFAVARTGASSGARAI